jgi:hypothetical protein
MRKQIELLKYHTNFAADRIDTPAVKNYTVNRNAALLKFLKIIDAAYKGGFSGA